MKSMRSEMRREPRQMRGEARVQRILDAAATLFDEVGYEAATSNSIAQRAGTSIGSFYHFFPDKGAVFQALANRYLNEIHGLFDEIAESPLMEQPLPELFQHLFVTVDCYFDNSPGIRAVFDCAKVSNDLKGVDNELRENLVTRIEALLSEKCPDMQLMQRQLIACVSLEVVCALQHLGSQGDKQFQDLVNEEIKKLLAAYTGLYVAQK